MSLSVHELKATDPTRFAKEHQAWKCDDLGYDWWDCVCEDAKTQGKEQGFDIRDIWFDLSYSQGDRAVWEGEVDLREFAKARGLLTDPVWSAVLAVAGEGYADSIMKIYSHGLRSTMRAESMSVNLCVKIENGVYAGMDSQDLIDAVGGDAVFDDIEEDVLTAAEEFAGDIYYQLRDEYEHLTSEESFIEYCDCNEVTFKGEVK